MTSIKGAQLILIQTQNKIGANFVLISSTTQKDVKLFPNPRNNYSTVFSTVNNRMKAFPLRDVK